MCERCKKNPASVYVENNINGVVESYNVCMECASKTSNTIDIVSIAGLLTSSLAGIGIDASRKCNQCGISQFDFLRLGKFGCGQCYESFEPNTEHVLRTVQGQIKHQGKIPARLHHKFGLERELTRLRDELAAAIKNEEFESAAVLRDEIKALQNEEVN